MIPSHILTYAGLLFVGTFAASFPFGFVRGFQESQGSPISESTLVIMKRFEWVVEALVVIGITAMMTVKNPDSPFDNALYAYAITTIVSYTLDVRVFHVTMREFVSRTAIGFLGCLPIGLLLASYANTST